MALERIIDEDINWRVKSEGEGIRTIQYPVEQTEGVGEKNCVEILPLCSFQGCGHQSVMRVLSDTRHQCERHRKYRI